MIGFRARTSTQNISGRISNAPFAVAGARTAKLEGCMDWSHKDNVCFSR